MGVSDQREAIGGDARASTPERNPRRHRFGRRSKRPGVDQLAAEQSLRIGASLRHHLAVHDRDEIRRSGPHIQENTGRDRSSHQPGRSRPVGCADRQWQRSGLPRCDKSAFHRIDMRAAARESGLERVQNESNALTLGTERLRELRGHGDRMQITGSAADRPCSLGQCGNEAGGVMLQFEGQACTADAGAIGPGFEACHLGVDATYVPAENRG